MTTPYLSVRRLARRLKNGSSEFLEFEPGVNVILGRPNTGKTKWIQTLDFLLGEAGEKNPLTPVDDDRLTDKYEAAGAEILVGQQSISIERRWLEPGAIGKVFVDGEAFLTKDFQHFLLEKLEIPLVHYPKGNPASGQAWPELSFRSLLRHIYRRQLLWTDIADQQQDDEQHACLMQFLGLAEKIFIPDYGELVRLKAEVERLKARREQHASVLAALTTELVAEPSMTVGVTADSIEAAAKKLSAEADRLNEQRKALISGALNEALAPDKRSTIEKLGERRAELSRSLEALFSNGKQLADRLIEMTRYRHGLGDELERMLRTEDAGAVLADLKVTHCPACDQPVEHTHAKDNSCFLCHQPLPDEPVIEELGAVRLKFERDRLTAEIKEADELVAVLERDAARVEKQSAETREALQTVESQLVPARTAVAALVQDGVSEIDMALGQVSERQRQLNRVKAALDVENDLMKQIEAKEVAIEPLEATIGQVTRATDYDHSASQLADGMNTYLNAINELRPKVWPHAQISMNVSRWSFGFKVGKRKWHAALGGTDSLYFLMAYHYGLMTLSDKPGCHFPGFVVIDMPADFVGEAVADKENFIVQPFIDLLAKRQYAGAQMIITGAAYDGLDGAHRLPLSQIYVAT